MKVKLKIKIFIDILMTLGLLFVSGYQFWGEAPHEWVGAGMFVLFLVHHLLNISWHKNVLKGRYTVSRTFQLIVDLCLFITMLMEMYSGIVLSRHVFSFLPIESGLALARKLHILGAYWGILFMSLHLGLHWNMMIGIVKKRMGIKARSRIRSLTGILSGGCIAVYGVSVFIRRDFPVYLFLKSEFVFLDYSEPVVLFYLDYLALMGLCIFVGHYIAKLCRKYFRKKEATG